MNRSPDPTGLQVWVGQLDQGVPRATVAERIENLSLEGAQLIVTHAYETYLRREPDALYAHWIAQVQGGYFPVLASGYIAFGITGVFQ